MKIKTKECWKINRGEGYAPIMSCEGIGDDHYFYVTPVWWLSGLLMSGVFLYGAHVSESLLGGCISGTFAAGKKIHYEIQSLVTFTIMERQLELCGLRHCVSLGRFRF